MKIKNKTKRTNRKIGIWMLISCFIMSVTILSLATKGAADPEVPGFDIEVYANVPQPAKLAFDPSGVLYVGNNGPLAMEKIYRVGIGGSPVEEYGDTAFPDPDSVAFDASGAISGTPGSVLVGNGGGPFGFIAAILPDQSTITPIGSEFGIGNPAHIEFDRTGRLLIADQNPPFRALATTGDDMVVLGSSFLALTVDGANRVYSSFLKNHIQVIASDGTQLPDLTPVDNNRYYLNGLVFGPFDSVWKGHLFARAENTDTGDVDIIRIASDGTIVLFGSGFGGDNRSDLAFGPDGALYVSDWRKNLIYRIVPEGDPYKYYWLEAEAAESITSPMQVEFDGNASGGQYIWVPNHQGNNWDGTGAEAIYTVNVTEEGKYILWGRVIAPTSSDDSFFAKVGSSANKPWSVADGSSWQWDKVNIKGGTDPVKYYLTTGNQTIKIGQREDGTKLDKLLLTNNTDFIPVGFGGN